MSNCGRKDLFKSKLQRDELLPEYYSGGIRVYSAK
jgi:hypothetical protein